jgi:hypothetical protein
LPPTPWFDYKEGTDEDLKAVWAYPAKHSSGEKSGAIAGAAESRKIGFPRNPKIAIMHRIANERRSETKLQVAETKRLFPSLDR